MPSAWRVLRQHQNANLISAVAQRQCQQGSDAQRCQSFAHRLELSGTQRITNGQGTRLIARSCTAAITLATVWESPLPKPSAQNSFTAVGANPGLRIATMQRLTFHCAPSSFTLVVITASALLCR